MKHVSGSQITLDNPIPNDPHRERVYQAFLIIIRLNKVQWRLSSHCRCSMLTLTECLTDTQGSHTPELAPASSRVVRRHWNAWKIWLEERRRSSHFRTIRGTPVFRVPLPKGWLRAIPFIEIFPDSIEGKGWKGSAEPLGNPQLTRA